MRQHDTYRALGRFEGRGLSFRKKGARRILSLDILKPFSVPRRWSRRGTVFVYAGSSPRCR